MSLYVYPRYLTRTNKYVIYTYRVNRVKLVSNFLSSPSRILLDNCREKKSVYTHTPTLFNPRVRWCIAFSGSFLFLYVFIKTIGIGGVLLFLPQPSLPRRTSNIPASVYHWTDDIRVSKVDFQNEYNSSFY